MLIHRWVDKAGMKGTGVMEEEEKDVWYGADCGEGMGQGGEVS